MLDYPPHLDLHPISHPVRTTAAVPGSKSITNRALVLAALAPRGHTTTLTGALASEDTHIMAECLNRLGFTLDADWPTGRVRITNRSDRIIPAEHAELDCGNSGTTMRFLTALLALGDGTYRLDGVPRMRERPIRDLLDALNQLGVSAVSEPGTGCPPVVLRPRGLTGGNATVRADVSSQFLSGLLLAAPRASAPLTITLTGPRVSEPYIAMTLAMLKHWGATVAESANTFTVSPGLVPIADYAIEPDASAASYFWGLAAITGGQVTVPGLTRNSLQGDVGFVDVLVQMGCKVSESAAGLTVTGGSHLTGIHADMGAISDTVMTTAAVACFATGPTEMTNVGHIRHKETDRIAAVANELRKLGAGVTETPTGLTIHPAPLHGATVETYRDHRMAMSLALIGVKVPGVRVLDPGCVAKTYPGFWHDLEATIRANAG